MMTTPAMQTCINKCDHTAALRGATLGLAGALPRSILSATGFPFKLSVESLFQNLLGAGVVPGPANLPDALLGNLSP